MIDHRYIPIWSYGNESIIQVFVASNLFIDPFPYVKMADQSIYRKARHDRADFRAYSEFPV